MHNETRKWSRRTTGRRMIDGGESINRIKCHGFSGSTGTEAKPFSKISLDPQGRARCEIDRFNAWISRSSCQLPRFASGFALRAVTYENCVLSWVSGIDTEYQQ